MNKKLSLAAISLLLVIFSLFPSCKSDNTEINPEFSRYISAFSYGRISSSSEIQIELTQDIPAVELNQPIDADLFSFSPAVKGSAYWTSSRNIKFVPELGELKSGQKYKAEFKLHKILKVDSEFKNFNFGFNVPEQNYKLDLLPYSPTKDNSLTWNSVEGTLTLADVADINKIHSMFTLSGDKADKAKITVTPSEAKGKYNILIDSLERSTSTDQTYTLKIDGAPIAAKSQSEETILIPQSNGSTFQVIDVRAMHAPQEGIRITFSDPLSLNQNIQGLIKPNGADNFSYDVNKNVVKLYLDNSRENTNVSLYIYKEVKSESKKPLDRSYNYNLSFEKNKPNITVENTGNILPNAENLIIPFKAVNLWAVDVEVIKIFESNVLGYLQSNDFGGSDELRRFGRLVKRVRMRLDEDPTKDLHQWNDFSLDLAELIKQDPGSIYRIEFKMNHKYSLYGCGEDGAPAMAEPVLQTFESELTDEEMAEWDNPNYYYYDNDEWNDYSWRDRDNPCTPSYYMGKKESCIVLASNIGLTAKMEALGKMTVATNDILTTKPLADVQVDIYNYQMQRIGSGKTQKHGFASIDYKGGVPYVVIATSGKEKGYLKVSSNLALSLSNFDVAGKEIKKGLKGYIYGERGVWRPGDSIYLAFILEDKDKVLPKDHPVSLEFYTPLGQLHHRTVKTNGVNGFYSFNMATEPTAITGNWRVDITVGGVKFYKTIKIETVKPNRLKIRLDAGKIIDASKGRIAATLSSQWLHGAPASNMKALVEMTLTPVSNPFEGYSKFEFNNPATNFYSDTYTLFEGRLDEKGNTEVSSQLPQAASAPGMLKAHIISRVFESGGDASIYAQSVPYSPYASYVGVRTTNENDYGWLETDKNNPIEIVTLDKDGKAVDRKVNVKVYKIQWSWWWNSSRENLAQYINSTSSEVVLNETITTVNGKSSVNFQVDYPTWGRYLIIAKDQQSGHMSGKTVYMDWPASRGRSDKGDPGGLTMLSFTSDKRVYNVGEKATITIPKSSNGRAMVSIEQGSKVLTRGWLETSAKEDTQYSLEITEEMAPNFYVSVNLLQPHGQTDNDLPIRMYGVININVENKNTILTPVIKMPDELRPEKEFTVSVSEKDKKDMTYTLAIVDEGLLDLTSFRTPNAWSDFYARQALTVRTWDMYELVVGAQTGKMGTLLSIGGDDEALKPKQNTMSRFKPVVKFIGPFHLKGGKTDTHKITLPSYFGSVRTMIVAGNDKGAYGNAEKATQVKNPLMVLSTLPRVAGPGEEILLPVNVFAMTDNVKNVSVNVEASNGMFEFVEGKSKNVTFKEQGDQLVYFKVKVAKKTGYEKVTIKVAGGGETATETIDIEIRNPNPQVLLSSQALVKTGETQALNISLDTPAAEDWVRMEVSRMPGVNINKNLSYLLQYPHGCSEQITSKVFPLLYVKAFKEFTATEKETIEKNIKGGIKELTARQLGDGGIVYWPGNTYPTEWVTTYAGHFLIEAKNAGYDVPSSVINNWKRFQKRAAQNWNRRELYKTYYSHSMSDLQQAYRLYTLALAGEAELGAMNRMKEMEGLTIQARWRLAAAYLIAGKKDAAKQLIENTTDEVDGYSFNNNTYGSASRDMAMIMETHLLLGNVDKALKLSHNVSKTLSADYISTQDASFGLIAMSKLADKMGKGVIAYEWELNGVAQPVSHQGTIFQEISIKPQEKININFKNTGEGQLFVRLLGRTQPMGDKIEPMTGNIKLHVSYVNADGEGINVSKLTQGTEFFANVIVQNTSGVAQTDMVLNQVFASGWEIFNDRLFVANNVQNQLYNYQDIRDDRVMTYFNLGAGYSTSFKVKLQAAYCGRFYLPGVSTETMYNPDEQSRTSGQWVEIVK